MMVTLISRLEAARLKLTHYFTGEPCKYGHVMPRYVSSKRCVACAMPTIATKLSQQKSFRMNVKIDPPGPYEFPPGAMVYPEMLTAIHARINRMMPELYRDEMNKRLETKHVTSEQVTG